NALTSAFWQEVTYSRGPHPAPVAPRPARGSVRLQPAEQPAANQNAAAAGNTTVNTTDDTADGA
ncbi:MAG: hypothetical protein FWE37_05580, partial [Spirochaetaceae bacterium]|nr:hypothetical protein [Spirochaetaceae bacterium]